MYVCIISLFSPSMDLHTVTSTISKIPMGGTDCSLPMKWAERKKAKIDVFIVYTDNETYFGDIHPSEVMFESVLLKPLIRQRICWNLSPQT